jgi:hypothetical protein
MKYSPFLLLLAVVTAFRLWAAAHMPLNDDEMYYWVWSRHPAYGYVDHPPVVAWLIALTSFLGTSPAALRAGFIVCLGLGAVALLAAARALGAGEAGAQIAAAIFVLIPEPELLSAEALPNPPYLLFWAASLLFAARAASSNARRFDAPLLGVALAGAALSRAFGLVLPAGILAWSLTPSGKTLRDRLWIALAVFAALYAPFIVWNATHHWWNVQFTLFGRGRSLPAQGHLTSVHSLRFLVYAAAFFALARLTARSGPKTLLAWTGVPLVLALTILAFVQNVETYWLVGPFASLCVGIGDALSRVRGVWRKIAVFVPAAASAFTAYAMVDAVMTRGGPLYDRDYTWHPAVRALVERARGAQIVTDTYEFAGPLAYYGVPVMMIGNDPQAAQWQAWFGDRLPGRALVVMLVPLEKNDGTRTFLQRMYRRVDGEPALHIAASATSATTFYTASAAYLKTTGFPARARDR